MINWPKFWTKSAYVFKLSVSTSAARVGKLCRVIPEKQIIPGDAFYNLLFCDVEQNAQIELPNVVDFRIKPEFFQKRIVYHLANVSASLLVIFQVLRS